MTARDGDGWTACGQGHRHWGRFGAAGLLVSVTDQPGGPMVLLQRRRRWGNHGATWGPPGGARDSHESAVDAALRESAEECGIDPDAISVHGILGDDHGAWSYSTVLGTACRPLAVHPLAEISEVRWVAAADVSSLALHPGFAARWPVLQRALEPLTLIVDAANVMGSRPDGWWRDRAGAARRLRDQLSGLAAAGVAALPEGLDAPALDRWFPRIILAVEGAARPVADDGPGEFSPPAAGAAPSQDQHRSAESLGQRGGQVHVLAAAGSGDDLIASLAATEAGRRLVVTADRELRRRCTAAGASVTGPGWLLAQW